MTDAKERAAARGGWPSRKTTLAEEAEALGPTDATSAWNAVMELTWEAFTLAERMVPRTPRAQWPSRLFQPGEKRLDSNGL